MMNRLLIVCLMLLYSAPVWADNPTTSGTPAKPPSVKPTAPPPSLNASGFNRKKSPEENAAERALGLDLCPPSGTTFPAGPSVILVEEKDSVLRIELSQLPETRLVGVLDNRELGKQIPLVWDPLESPRLGYNVTVQPGTWHLSFRSDPLYRTTETTGLTINTGPTTKGASTTDSQRVSLSYRAVREDLPASLLGCTSFSPVPSIEMKPPVGWSLVHGASIRLQPFNLLDYVQKSPEIPPWYSRKDDIAVGVFISDSQKRRLMFDNVRKSLGDIGEIKAELFKLEHSYKILTDKNSKLENDLGAMMKLGRAITDAEKADNNRWSSELTKNTKEAEKLRSKIAENHDKIRELYENSVNTNKVLSAINRIEVSENKAVSGRSLADPVPQVVVDLFSIIAEIAFDRAKAKSFSLLSERAIRLVCSELTWGRLRIDLSKTIRNEELWWIPTTDKAMLPRTCETVRSLRIQELAAAGKVIYAALLNDITAIPVDVLANFSVWLAKTELDPSLHIGGIADVLRDLHWMNKLMTNFETSDLEQINANKDLKDQLNLCKKQLNLLLSGEKGQWWLAAMVSSNAQSSDKREVISLLAGQMKEMKDNCLNALQLGNDDKSKVSLSEYWASIESAEHGWIAVARNIKHSYQSRQLGVPLLRLLVPVLYKAISGGVLDEREVQLLFITFAKEFARLSEGVLEDLTDKSAVCPVRLAFAIVSECQSRGGCDAGAISQYLQVAAKMLPDERCTQVDPKTWPAITSFISRSLEIVRPTKSVSATAQLRNVSELLFDVTELLLSKQSTRDFPLTKPALTAMRSVFVGALEQEVQKVLVGFAQLLGQGLSLSVEQQRDCETLKTLRKFSALAGAVASYSQNYAGTGENLDEKQAKAQREARKKSIESMMDLTTSRTERAGDLIVSLGINPGFQAVGAQLGPGTKEQSNLFYTQLTLPTGIALQWLPKPNCIVGGHLQFSLLDLAQFVSFDGNTNLSMNNLRWSDFAMAGVQGGLLLGNSPNALFFLGADLRYSPTLSFQPKLSSDATPDAMAEQDRRRGVFRAALTAGYYVPFFDFN